MADIIKKIEKLNKVFIAYNKLNDDELNLVTAKVDEIIENINAIPEIEDEIYNLGSFKTQDEAFSAAASMAVCSREDIVAMKYVIDTGIVTMQKSGGLILQSVVGAYSLQVEFSVRRIRRRVITFNGLKRESISNVGQWLYMDATDVAYTDGKVVLKGSNGSTIGDGATIPVATSTADGLMSKEQVAKLSGVDGRVLDLSAAMTLLDAKVTTAKEIAENAASSSADAQYMATNAKKKADTASLDAARALGSADSANAAAEEAKGLAETAQSTAEGAASAAADASAAASDAAKKAQKASADVATLTGSVNTALEKADAAQTTADEAKSLAGTADAAAKAAIASAVNANKKSNEAKEAAGAVQTTADAAKTVADEAKEESAEALEDAQQANVNASSAVITANSAKNAAKTAKDAADAAQSTANQNSELIDALDRDYQGWKSVMNVWKGKVEEHIKGDLDIRQLDSKTTASGEYEIYNLNWDGYYVGMCVIGGKEGGPATQMILSSSKLIFNGGTLWCHNLDDNRKGYIYSRCYIPGVGFNGWHEMGKKKHKKAFKDGKVIVHKSVPVRPRKGARYYFTNGILKIKLGNGKPKGFDELMSEGGWKYLVCDGSIKYSCFDISSDMKSVVDDADFEHPESMFVYMKNMDGSVVLSVPKDGELNLKECRIEYYGLKGVDGDYVIEPYNGETTTPYLYIENGQIKCNKPMSEVDIMSDMSLSGVDSHTKKEMWRRRGKYPLKKSGKVYMAVKPLKYRNSYNGRGVYKYRKCRNKLPLLWRVWMRAFYVVKRHRSCLYAEKRVYVRE